MGIEQSADLTVVCGLMLSGKTTVARYLRDKLGYHLLDIDDLRNVCFGMPPKEQTEASHQLHMRQFGSSYRVLHLAIEEQIAVIRSPLVVTASLSSYEKGQVPLMQIAERVHARLRVIWVRGNPDTLSDDQLEGFIKERAASQKDYAGTMGTIHGVGFLRERYKKFDPIRVPGSLELVTWPARTKEETCEAALRYCDDPATGYLPDAH